VLGPEPEPLKLNQGIILEFWLLFCAIIIFFLHVGQPWKVKRGMNAIGTMNHDNQSQLCLLFPSVPDYQTYQCLCLCTESLFRFNPTSLRFSAVDTPDPIPILARGVSPLEGLDTAGLGSDTVIFWGLSFFIL
jgi:hypothetical protein